MNYIWITNIEQVNYYINHGGIVRQVEILPDGKPSVAFIKNETKRLYYEWKKMKGLDIY